MIPLKRCASFFQDKFGFPMSDGTIVNFVSSASNKLDDFENKIKKSLSKAKYLHIDETGVNILGKNAWIHTYSSDKDVFLKYHRNRGKIAFDEIGIIKKFKGTMITDFYKPYWEYDHCKHLACHAHLRRELQEAIDFEKQEWAKEFLELFERIYKRRSNGIALTSEEIKNYEWEYEDIITRADEECHLVKKRSSTCGKIAQTYGRNLLTRFMKFRHWILGILYDSKAPFTNNLAERDLRMSKVKMKISGCFRGDKMANHYCRIQSYVGTLRKRGTSAYSGIEMLVST